jgi:serine/threonine protein kinase
MFEREATLSARMRHPNIVRVLDHGDYEGERYLAMEELHGRDLSSVMVELVKRGAPAPGLGVFVGGKVCRALAYVHGLADDAGVEAPTLETLLYLAQLRDAATTAGQPELAEAAAPVCHRLHQARTLLSHKR